MVKTQGRTVHQQTAHSPEHKGRQAETQEPEPNPSIRRSTEQTEDTKDPSSTSVEKNQGPAADTLHQKGLTNSERKMRTQMEKIKQSKA